MKNHKGMTQASLPKGSIYETAKETVETTMSVYKKNESAMSAQQWAEGVAHSTLKKKPRPNIWTGGLTAWLVRIAMTLTFRTLDGTMKKMNGLDVVKQKVQQ